MKKLLMVFVLVGIIGAGTAFADYPDGFGIGLRGGYGLGGLVAFGEGDWNWSGGATRHFLISAGGGGLTLKFPKLPIFWGINFSYLSYWFVLGLTFDYYFIHNQIGNIPLHWYFGIGGYFDFGIGRKDIWGDRWGHRINGGVRLPIGLALMFKFGGRLEALELNLGVAPSIGVGYIFKDSPSYLYDKGNFALHWGVPIEFGIRFWF